MYLQTYEKGLIPLRATINADFYHRICVFSFNEEIIEAESLVAEIYINVLSITITLF